MMAKKMLLGLGLCSLLAFPATNANAESGFCSGAEVLQAGSHNLGKVVLLRNTRTDCGNWAQNAQTFFFLDNSAQQANAMLASALSAQASGAAVTIFKPNNSYTAYSTVVGLYSAPVVAP
jgi:hypothetical protein